MIPADVTLKERPFGVEARKGFGSGLSY